MFYAPARDIVRLSLLEKRALDHWENALRDGNKNRMARAIHLEKAANDKIKSIIKQEISALHS